jgi:hypothetical protein
MGEYKRSVFRNSAPFIKLIMEYKTVKVLPTKESFIEEYQLEDLSICDSFIEAFNSEDAKPYLTTGKVSSGYDPSIKKSLDLYYDPNTQTEYFQKYLNELENIVKKYTEKYVWSTETTMWRIYEPIQVQYYGPNDGFYKWHCERSGTNLNRHLVFMTYLNDVTDGGETEWFYQHTKTTARKGKTVVWPTDWTYTHRGVPSPTQEKYIITGWYNFQDLPQASMNV